MPEMARMGIASEMGEEVRPKYGNKKIGKYDSKKESVYAIYLHSLQNSRKISALEEQVRFELIPSQYVDGKCVERAVTYTADFTYWDDAGKLRVIDAKGFRTQQYIIRRKLMLFIHKIRIEEV